MRRRCSKKEECGAAITNYLDALSSQTAAPLPATGAAITSYLDALSSKASHVRTTSAAAVTSYLDGLNSGAIVAEEGIEKLAVATGTLARQMRFFVTAGSCMKKVFKTSAADIACGTKAPTKGNKEKERC